MALLRRTKLASAAVVIVATLLGLSLTGEGFKQELWLYTEDTNALYFHTHVPDLTRYNSILHTVTRVCGIGEWMLSSELNYQKHYEHAGSILDSKIHCRQLNTTNVKSLRYWVANDTSTDAISLYAGDNWDGDEIYVTTRAKTGISTPIQTKAGTGNSSWMLYEGQNLDGKSVCFKVPYSNWHFNIDSLDFINMTAIGSLFKGCDLNAIRTYRDYNFW